MYVPKVLSLRKMGRLDFSLFAFTFAYRLINFQGFVNT